MCLYIKKSSMVVCGTCAWLVCQLCEHAIRALVQKPRIATSCFGLTAPARVLGKDRRGAGP